MNTEKKISNIIQFHRKKSGLTQLQLAQLAGVGKTVIFDIEKGKETVQWNTLLKVLKVLNINVVFESQLMKEFFEKENSNA
jgi:y4mF family transcriptional regulator